MVCPDCGVRLVDEHPGRGMAAERPDRSWVIMGQVLSRVQSEMAKGSLDSNNIPSVIMAAGLAGAGRSVMAATGLDRARDEGSLIMVPREFREDAMIVLEAVLGEDLIEFGSYE